MIYVWKHVCHRKLFPNPLEIFNITEWVSETSIFKPTTSLWEICLTIIWVIMTWTFISLSCFKWYLCLMLTCCVIMRGCWMLKCCNIWLMGSLTYLKWTHPYLSCRLTCLQISCLQNSVLAHSFVLCQCLHSKPSAKTPYESDHRLKRYLRLVWVSLS